jgi:hypothetical protein
MRLCVLALSGLLALPAAAAAQDPIAETGQLPGSRISVTPFVGVRVPYSAGNAYVGLGDGRVFAIEEERGGGPVAGAEVALRAWGPLSVLGSLAYANSGEHLITLRSESETVRLVDDAPEMWLGKLALAYRLPEPRPDNRRFRPAGYLVAGPSWVRTDWSNDDEFGGEWTEGANHWGVNLGVHTATLIGPSSRVALHLGLEDYVTFWDNDRLAARDEALYGGTFDDDALVRIDYDVSNILMLRAGLSLRF